jgi:(2R)-ethylmalonyl-CoA mutase
VHVVGLSILSGSHRAQVADVLARLRAEGLDEIPVVVGGIIPPEDAARLFAAGVAAVFTPKDHDLALVMDRVVDVLEQGRVAAA